MKELTKILTGLTEISQHQGMVLMALVKVVAAMAEADRSPLVRERMRDLENKMKTYKRHLEN